MVILALGSVTLVSGLSAANTQTLNLSGTVSNVAPSLSANALSPTSPGPTAGTTTTITASVTATDNNGYQDVTTGTGFVKVNLKTPSGTAYFAPTAMTCTGGSGVSVTCTYAFTLNYYDPTGTWTLYYNATDINAGAATLVFQTFTYAASKLIGSVSPATATFAAMNPGVTSTASTITVNNGGNTASNVCAAMSLDLTGSVSGSITKDNVKASASSGMTSPLTMSTTSTAITGVSLPGTNGGSVATYWTLTVPTGTPVGTYTGSVTLASC